MKVKTRFCPSPTGLIHLGNARTALFSALFARKMGGVFLLRIEDTDAERSKQEYTDSLMQDLQWLGLNWQEGPNQDDESGFYYQSKRQAIYADYYQRLATAGMVYPCFCTEEELTLTRKIQRASGKPPRYPGTCCHLSEVQIDEKLKSGLKPTLRFKVADNEIVEFNDLVRGSQKFNTNDIGDFIVRRGDGTAPFVFCNAIDDALMEVTHVLRGEDHVANTPRQLMILQALGFEAPQYGHISLIMGPDGTPLSKRNGSRSIQELRNEGYLPEAIVNYLARLGHYYGHDNLLTLEQLAEEFTLAGLSKSPAKFNSQQLSYWQKQAIDAIDASLLWDWLSEKDQQLVPAEHRELFLKTMKPNIEYPQDLSQWAQVVFDQLPELTDEERAVISSADDRYFESALLAIGQLGKENYKEIMQFMAEKTQVKGKQLYQPLRVALTGSLHGPELAHLLMMMSNEKIKERLVRAQKIL